MKRTLALFLSLMMVFSLFSGLNITAGAAETDVTETAAEAEVTESTTESELPELDLHLPEPESETEGSAAKADLAEIGAEPDLADTGATYELWLGSTQVTDANKSDILGDGGKAQFDPSTHTLTLNNPTINGEHNYSKIFCNGFDLTVKGSYTMTSAQSDNALTVFDHDLTLDGNFTLLAWCYAVETSYDICVNGGRVTAKLEEGDSEACQAFCSDAGSITFGDNVEYFEAAVTSTWNTVYAVAYSTEGTVTLSSKLKLSTPEGGSFREGSCYYYESGKQKRAKTVIIEPANPSDIKYEVWVGATQVTRANKNDILGDGKARYDPATRALTLNNPTISTNYSSGGKTHKIYAAEDLTVKGSYTMTSYAADYGIYGYMNLTLDGDFTILSGIHGVYARFKLTIYGSLVGRANSTTYTSSAGIKASQIKFGEITRVEAEGKKTMAIYAERGLTIPPQLYVSTPSKSSIENGTVIDNSTNSPIIAKRTVIDYDDNCVVVCGSEKEIFGSTWDISNQSNRMKRTSDGKYYLTYNVTRAYKDVQLRVHVESNHSDPEWFGDASGNHLTFDLTGAGTFVVDFVPESKSVSISGPNVIMNTKMEVNKVYAVGNGKGTWLNGAAWLTDYVDNEMPEVTDGVYEIAFNDVPVQSWYYQTKFTINGTWTHNFGGTFSGNGIEADAVYNGENIQIEFDDCPDDIDTCTIKLRLDLRNYDHSTKTGAKFTVTIVYGEYMFLGDTDGDGNVEIRDATWIQRHAADIDIPFAISKKTADIDGDGEITVMDATAIQYYLANMKTSYPIGKPV